MNPDPRVDESSRMMGRKQEFQSGNEEAGSVWPQYVAAFVACMGCMSAGCALGWTSPTLPLLKQTKYIVLTVSEEAWIGALVAVGATLSPLPAGVVATWVGHKVSLMGAAVLYLVGWLAVATARTAAVIYVARIILGIATGVCFTICPTYLGEISQANVRGAVGSMVQVFANAGFMYAYLVGPWTSYVVLASASAVIPAVFLLGLFFIPDSPYQLLRRGKTTEARSAFYWLRGNTSTHTDRDQDEELRDIELEVADVLKEESSLKDLVANRATLKALLLSQGLLIFQQLCGINAVLFFAESILGLSVSSLSPSVATIIVGAVMQLSVLLTPLLVDRTGRRILLLISAAGMSLALVVLGLFFYFSNTGADTSKYGFVPTASLVVYIIVYSFGFGPLAWAVSAELFAPNVRGRAAALTATTCWFFCFLVTFFFQNLVNTLGSHVVFWMFAGCCLCAGVFVFFLLPETKGRTFREIQDLLGA